MDSILSESLVVLFLFQCVKAENKTNQNDFNPLHPSVPVVLTILSLMFGVTFLIVACARYCHRQEPNEFQNPDETVARSRSRFSGIDRTVIDSLPFFRFSSLKGSKEGLECTVCLSRFEDTETLRLLPKCRHSFHVNCIDKWLESHSSCPLCRYKVDAADVRSWTHTNSFRHQDESNLEFFIQREDNHGQSSLRFSVSDKLQKLARGNREEPLIRDFMNSSNSSDDKNKDLHHKFKHRIIVSDVVYKGRWSDANTSDLMSLNCEMLNFLSSRRFSSQGSRSGRFTNELSEKERVLKIKDDMERKKLYESKLGRRETSSSTGKSTNFDIESGQSMKGSKILDSSEKRSMSEITNLSRFTESNSRKDDHIRELWLPIAKRTIQRFSSEATSSDAAM